jgi:hypothetical protein
LSLLLALPVVLAVVVTGRRRRVTDAPAPQNPHRRKDK